MTFPPAVIRLHPQRGRADCVIAALATYLRVDPEEVLIAASKVAPNVWREGLGDREILRVARRLGYRVRWRRTFDAEEDTGVLQVEFRDQIDPASGNLRKHAVTLIEGAVFEADHNPVTRWEASTYLSYFNAEPKQLLEMMD